LDGLLFIWTKIVVGIDEVLLKTRTFLLFQSSEEMGMISVMSADGLFLGTLKIDHQSWTEKEILHELMFELFKPSQSPQCLRTLLSITESCHLLPPA
jgi:hypothetical protein